MLGGNHLRAKDNGHAGTNQKIDTHNFGWFVDEVTTDDRCDASPTQEGADDEPGRRGYSKRQDDDIASAVHAYAQFLWLPSKCVREGGERSVRRPLLD